MLKEARASQSEEHALAGRTRSQIPRIRELGISVLALVGVSAVLVAGLVTTTGAQTNSSATYHLKRGVERYHARDFEAAIADFSEAIEIHSGLVKSPGKNRHRSNFKDQQKAEIADDDRIIVADSFNALAYYNRGMAWQAKGDVDRALDDFNQAIAINPRYRDAYLIRGRAWHSKGGFNRAIADYNQAMALDPRSALAYNNRGIARKDLQDLAGAITDFDQALRLDPRLVQAYINRGAARCAVGDLAGATADLNQAISSDPHNPMAYNNRGTIRQAAGDFTGALADYNQAIRLDPESALAYVNRGLTRLQQGDLDGAETDFARALSLAPALKPRIERFLRRKSPRDKER